MATSRYSKKPPIITETFRKKISQIVLVLVLLYVGIQIFWPSNLRFNSLELSATDIADQDIPIFSLRQIDNISKSTIRDLRASYFDNIPSLLSSKYQLSTSVFGAIEDNAPWLSEQSYFFYGADGTLHPGTPAEDIGLANPLLLLNPNFEGWSIRGALKWNRDLVIKQNALDQKDFPLYPKPSGLQLKIAQKEIVVAYDLSDYKSMTIPWLLEALKVQDLTFSPVTYNAKDFGFSWIKLSPESININQQKFEVSPIFITGIKKVSLNECETIESGCNMRMALGQMPPIKVSNLPAEALFYLWLDKPSSPEQEPEPDLKYRIILK